MVLLFDYVKPETLERQFPLVCAQMDKLQELSQFSHRELEYLKKIGRGASHAAAVLSDQTKIVDGTILEIATTFGYGKQAKLHPSRQ